jgi:hypothetical protein
MCMLIHTVALPGDVPFVRNARSIDYCLCDFPHEESGYRRFHHSTRAGTMESVLLGRMVFIFPTRSDVVVDGHGSRVATTVTFPMRKVDLVDFMILLGQVLWSQFFLVVSCSSFQQVM